MVDLLQLQLARTDELLAELAYLDKKIKIVRKILKKLKEQPFK